MATNPSYGRRDFLKDSVFSTVKAAQEFVKEADGPREKPVSVQVRLDWLRPPGAVEEALFLERCTKCSDCVTACPPHAIAVHPTDGTPVLYADQSPCLLCEDFPCVRACGTEALVPVEHGHQVRMGVAVISQRLCTAGQGCHACVSRCPTDALAMDFESLRLLVATEACVGCGMCEMVCKTVNDHVAIRVVPARHLTENDR
ncbi:MAG: 4Fe-4S dicluster domain-containing protein [Nitrospira sp.]|nr:4Fe-4S dicluster domain-containing protein [Nitrospira sp.]MDR4464111.1 4Fe-4S dicluster domain-containing protein [Nitrospira sp.]MDR4470254.1 4Fe-4S dicluster domain-containing protein [Nitrospira sp.]